MTSKQNATADISTVEPRRDPRQLADPRTLITDPASGPIVYFDGAPVYAVGAGVASITLTAQRQILDAYGQVTEDRIVAALLRAPLSVMLQLRDVITNIEKLAIEQAVAAIAAAEAEPPGRLPH